jgi:hypothetical protein
VITLDLSERKEEEEEEQITKRTVAIIIITIIDESHWDKTIKRQRVDTFFLFLFLFILVDLVGKSSCFLRISNTTSNIGYIITNRESAQIDKIIELDGID